MTLPPALRRALILAGVTVVYFLAARAGLQFAVLNNAASAVWPPTGIAIAALLVFGLRTWPAVLAGAVIVDAAAVGGLPGSLAVGIGNTLEAVVAAVLIRRLAGGVRAFDRARDTFAFAGLAALACTVSASIGVATLVVTGTTPLSGAGPVWITWWLGDVAGAIVFAPILILWTTRPRPFFSKPRVPERGALILGTFIVSAVIFGDAFHTGRSAYPLMFLCFPLLVWAAFRFGPRGAATVTTTFSVVAVWATTRGLGPFVLDNVNTSLLLLQAFIAVNGLIALATAAVVSERNRVEAQLRYDAATDPLTGLGNYRQLVLVMNREIERARAAGGTFAVLLLDLDDLKAINDRDGHLTGNRALLRLASALGRLSRPADTIARYGGDEFAIVLAGGDESAARALGQLLERQLHADTEPPAITVSMGLALYPRDGRTTERLLDAADRGLYVAKSLARSPGGTGEIATAPTGC